MLDILRAFISDSITATPASLIPVVLVKSRDEELAIGAGEESSFSESTVLSAEVATMVVLMAAVTLIGGSCKELETGRSINSSGISLPKVRE